MRRFLRAITDTRPFLRAACVLPLVLMGFIALTACTRAGDHVDASKVFHDPHVAALAQAAVDGDVSRLQELVSDGVDLDTRGERGVTPLAWAMLHQSPDGFAALLDAGADPATPAVGDDPVILMAAMADDPTYLKILLAHGVDVNKPRGRSHRTPLMAALMNDHTDAPFRQLLKAGADPDVTDKTGNTALHVAAEAGDYARVLALLNAGANPRARNAQHATFQSYLHMTPTHLLTAQARRQLAAIDQWLQAHDIPVEKP